MLKRVRSRERLHLYRKEFIRSFVHFVMGNIEHEATRSKARDADVRRMITVGEPRHPPAEPSLTSSAVFWSVTLHRDSSSNCNWSLRPGDMLGNKNFTWLLSRVRSRFNGLQRSVGDNHDDVSRYLPFSSGESCPGVPDVVDYTSKRPRRVSH